MSSSVSVIVLIIVLLASLVCYAFISQTLAHKREQRSRVLTALKSRCRNFKFMLNGFPEGFLTRDLTLLVEKSLVEVCEQLVKLEPKEPSHLRDLQWISALLADTQRTAKPAKVAPLENPQQIKEVKMCLEELHRFIYRQEQNSLLKRTQADAYRNQIKSLVLRMTVDSYILNGRTADQNSKTKLAIHYFELALNLLVREGQAAHFEQKTTFLKAKLADLKERLTQETPTPKSHQDEAEEEEIANEWEKFSSEADTTWKKKHAYD